MKRVGIVTGNRLFAQSLAANNYSAEYQLEFFALTNPRQAIIDAAVFDIDVALVDIAISKVVDVRETVLELCTGLRAALPKCRMLLIASQDDSTGYDTAISAINGGLADDYIFYDTSLEYLLAKLAAM